MPDDSDFLAEFEFESEALMVCALRLDGWRLLQEVTGKEEGDFSAILDPVIKERILHEDDRLNHLAYFGLQRYLGKWGGEDRTPYADEHIAYRLLFLHLYHQAVPRGFEYEEYHLRWEREFVPRLEEAAAEIRRTFTRIGSGPDSYYELQRRKRESE